MATQGGHSGSGKKTRLWGILPKRFGAALSASREGAARRSRRIRPISMLIATLAMLAAILGVTGLVAPPGNVQATPGTGVSSENLGCATLGPFRIVPVTESDPFSGDTIDVTMHKVTMDVGGNAGWHIHPGPTFGIITQGEVEFTRLTKGGCVEQVFGPREGFVEPANEVHIARNVGEELLVIYLTRLNIPVGGETTDSSPEEPDCNLASGSQSGSPSSANRGDVTAKTTKLELDSLDEEQDFNRYDSVVERLEQKITSLLAEATENPTANMPRLSREIGRLDDQIDMLRLAAMGDASVARLTSSEPIVCGLADYRNTLGHELFDEAWRDLLGRTPFSEPTICQIDKYARRHNFSGFLAKHI
jgi:quercetin dioxygenase-like cupin family protein